MSKKYPDENVLVISRALFDELGSFQGLSLEPEKYLGRMMDPENNYFLARDDAEEDPSHKQIIPYAIFKCGDKYLHYVRGGGGGEKRLAAKGSLGIGGHINDGDIPADHVDADLYKNGVEREIDEELNIEGSHTQKILGLLNDDSNAVGQVHLGVVHLFELENENVTPGEAQIETLEFLTLDQLEAKRDQMESWSQICLDGLLRLD